MLLSGPLWTIATALCAWVIAFCLGSVIGVLRTVPNKAANAVGTAYVKDQTAAASALGMKYWQTMGYVVLPRAFRNTLPLLLTQTIVLFQDTSLVYVLSLSDFMGVASKIAQRDGRLVAMHVFAALVYFAVCLAASFPVRRVQGLEVVGVWRARNSTARGQEPAAGAGARRRRG